MEGKGPVTSRNRRPGTEIADAKAAEVQIARWEQERTAGRTSFILRRGVLTWGIPAALLTIIYKVVQEQGFVHTPELTATVRSAAMIAIVVFPLCGWLFGRWLWDIGEARYRAMTRHGDQA